MIVAFLGPSLPAREAKGFHLLPPARQGDVWRAIALRPRAIALIDGVFESQPSVWHQEILDALDAGIPVVGGASMGALRAAELHTLGMAGAGRIFRWYRDGTVIDDSEVALLHGGAEHGFRPLTVPQVNVRWSARRWLPPRAARALVDASGSIFYQERTLPRVLELVPPRWRARFRLIDLKAEDARQVLRAARAARRLPVHPREPPASSFARRRRLLATAPAVHSGDARNHGPAEATTVSRSPASQGPASAAVAGAAAGVRSTVDSGSFRKSPVRVLAIVPRPAHIRAACMPVLVARAPHAALPAAMAP